MDATKTLEKLRSQHNFPGPYHFKVIAEQSPSFAAQVEQIALEVLGPAASVTVDDKMSAQGRYQAVHLRVQIAQAQQVLQIYERLRQIEGVKFLL